MVSFSKEEQKIVQMAAMRSSLLNLQNDSYRNARGLIFTTLDGTDELYDESIFSLFDEVDGIDGARILEIGAGGFHSTFDLIRRGASVVHTYEHSPFGIPAAPLDVFGPLIKLQSSRKKTSLENITIVAEAAKLGAPDISEGVPYDLAYFFFPDVSLIIRHTPLTGFCDETAYASLLEFVCHHLNGGGVFRVISELPQGMPIHPYTPSGFSREVTCFPGKPLYTILEDWAQSEEPLPRPAREWNLRMISYRKGS